MFSVTRTELSYQVPSGGRPSPKDPGQGVAPVGKTKTTSNALRHQLTTYAHIGTARSNAMNPQTPVKTASPLVGLVMATISIACLSTKDLNYICPSPTHFTRQ
jgi:hypothetical protein